MNETQEHILRTSLMLFLQKSYRDVTMKEIVEKTGLSKGAFYHYFESKEALFKEIVTHFFSFGQVNYKELEGNSFREFCTHFGIYLQNSMKQLSAFVGTENTNENPYNFFFILFEAVRRFPEFLEIELEMHKKDVAEWVKIIQNAKRTGEIKSSIPDEDIAEMFLYCFDGITLRSITIKNPEFMEREIMKVIDNLYESLKS